MPPSLSRALPLLLLACATPTAPTAPPAPPAAPLPPPTPTGVVTGQRAPALDLLRLDETGRWRLADLTVPDAAPQGVLVSFMASWCGPCAASLPTLAALERDNPGLTIVTIATDDSPAGQSAELHKVRAAGIQGPVLAGEAQINAQWVGTGGSVPRYVFVARTGDIIAQDRGFGDNVKGLMPRQVARTLAAATAPPTATTPTETPR